MEETQKEEIATLVKNAIKESGLLEVNRKVMVEGEKPEGNFKSFGDFLCTIKNNPNDVRLKALSEGTDSAGGFTVPEEYRKGIELRALEMEIVRPYATKIPMGTDTLNYPVIKDTTHASSVFGGIIAYWTEEAGSKTAKDPVFGRVKLIAKKLTGFTYASDELLEDSAIALESMLVDMFGKAIGWWEDYAFINGNGVGQPLGILNSGAMIYPLRATANLIAMADLGRIMARMYPASLYGPNTVWIANNAILGQLLALASTSVTWIALSQGATEKLPVRLFGMPILFTEKVPTLGTAADIGLYDLSYYLIGDRKGLKVDRSIEYRFSTDETTWRFVKRVDGQPLVDSAFTPKNGSTLSPFVALSAATA